MLAALLATCLPLMPAERGGRPELSGPEQTLDAADGRYRLHFTHSGDDAIPADDADDDGVADWAARALQALADGEQRYADEGWRLPMPDDGDGGSDAIDVYVRDIAAFGFAYPEDGPDGPSCWMELDPNVDSLSPMGIESVAVHEQHHCVQYRYSSTSHPWIYEATATWQQYRLHIDPTLQAAVDVLWNQRLRGADAPMDTLGGRFEYAGFVVMKWWAEYDGRDLERLVDLWEAVEAEPDWALALDAAAQDAWGLSLGEAALHHAIWNRFACSRDDGQHYDPAEHACTFPATSVDVVGLAGGVELDLPEGALVSAYGDLPAGGDDRPVELDCAFDGEGWLGLVAVDADGAAGEEAWAALDGGTTLRLQGAVDGGGVFAVVATKTGEGPAALSCTAARVEAVAEPDPQPQGCSCGAGGGGAGGAALLLILLTGPCRASRRSGAC